MKILHRRGEIRRSVKVLVDGDLESYGYSLSPEWAASISTERYSVEFTREEMLRLIKHFSKELGL